MTVKQISIFLENKPGKLAELTKMLSDNGVNLRSLSLAEASDFGIVRMITEDVYNATTVLKEAGYICSVTDVIGVEVRDEIGALANIISFLGEADINIEYMYALTDRTKGVAYMIMRTNDQQKAIKTLGTHGMKVVGLEQLF